MKVWLILNALVLVLGVLGLAIASFLWIFIYYLWFVFTIVNVCFGIWSWIKNGYKKGFKIIGISLLVILLEFIAAVLFVLPLMGHSVGEY